MKSPERPALILAKGLAGMVLAVLLWTAPAGAQQIPPPPLPVGSDTVRIEPGTTKLERERAGRGAPRALHMRRIRASGTVGPKPTSEAPQTPTPGTSPISPFGPTGR